MMDIDAVIPPRSVLIDLAPMGVGTSFVESMDGYLWRLAREHDVSMNAIKTYVHEGEDMTRSMLHARRADCPCPKALRIAQRLPALTSRSDTGTLGLGRLHGHLTSSYAIRSQRCWCPDCIVEMRGSTPYLPLVWNLEGYSYCSKHARPVVTACPGCDLKFDVTSEWLPVQEVCPACRTNLCEVGACEGSESLDGQASEAEIALNESLEKFCLQAADIPEVALGGRRSGMERAINHALQSKATPSIQELSIAIGLTPLTLDRFRDRNSALPALPALSRLSVICGVSLAGILYEPLWQENDVQVDASALKVLPPAYGKPLRNYGPLVAAVHQAIASGKGTRLAEVAKTLGVSDTTLRTAIGPALIEELSDAARVHRRAVLQKSFDDLVDSMKEICRRLKRQGVELSAARVARELGRFGEHAWFMKAYRKAERVRV